MTEYEQNCHGAEDYQKVAEFVHAQFQPPAQTEMPQPAATDEIQNESDVPEPPMPEIQPSESDEKQPESQAPSAEPAGDDESQIKPPFEIRTIPQSEPQPPTEFTPSNREPNQPEAGHREY